MSTTVSATRPFGLMHQMWQLPDDSAARFFAETVEDVAYADQLGFDSVWLAEHHYGRPHRRYFSRVPDADMFLARLVPETERIRLATGIKILPLDEPERVAERIFLLDALSGGRAGCGLGQGSPDEMGVRTLTKEAKRALFRERLARLVDIVTTHQAEGDLTLVPESGQRTPRILWAGVRDPESVALAAKLDVNLIIGEAEVGIRQAPIAANYLASSGAGEIRGARIVCIADTTEEAFATAAPIADLIFNGEQGGVYYREAVQAGAVPSARPASLGELCDQMEFFVGTPDAVAAKLANYVKTVQLNALNVVVHPPGISQAAARRSMELFMSDVADKVQPYLAPSPVA
jgi:alkanesulfonate monooxygenase SsuD/methylene tetrahydromethanopterin reductase-like flavin-dependent oxidoreductase (luciferase family)